MALQILHSFPIKAARPRLGLQVFGSRLRRLEAMGPVGRPPKASFTYDIGQGGQLGGEAGIVLLFLQRRSATFLQRSSIAIGQGRATLASASGTMQLVGLMHWLAQQLTEGGRATGVSRIASFT